MENNEVKQTLLLTEREEDIQKAANLNRQYMSALFKRQEGISIQQYIIRVRMERALTLLKQGISVTETARLCGYESIYAFSKAFKREIGVSPTEYVVSSDK